MAINSRIVLSFLVIVGVVALVAAIAVAAFSDTASLTGNTLSTGTADLKIADDDGGSPDTPYGDSVSGFDFDGLVPGETSEDFVFWLTNDAEDMSLDISAKVNSLVDSSPGDELSTLVTLEFTCDTDGDGSFDSTPASALVSSLTSTSLDLLVNIPAEDTVADDGTTADEFKCKVNASLDSGADNDVAAETLTFDIEFTGTQDVGP